MNFILSFRNKYENMSKPLKASLWFAVCNILQKGINMLTIPIFTRLLTDKQYGLFSVYQSWYSIIVIFATLQLYYGVFNNGMIKYKNEKDKFASSMQGLSTTTTATLFIVYLLFRQFWNNIFGLTTLLMLVMFCELLIAPAFSYWATKQRFEYKYIGQVVTTILMSIMSLVVGVIAVLLTDYKAEARIISFALVQIFFCGFFYILNFVKGKTFFNNKYWKFALGFNLPLIPHFLSVTILNQSDRLMINNLCGTAQAGIYSVAYSASIIVNLVISSINSTLTPWIYNNIKDNNLSNIKKNSKFILVFVMLCILLLISFAPEIVRILAPINYYEARWIIPPVAASTFFTFMYNLFSNIEYYYEESRYVMYASVSGAILNIILNYIFIKQFGYLAAGYTTLICYIFFCFCHFYFMQKVCKKNSIKANDIYDIKFMFILGIIILVATIFLLSIYNLIIIRYIIIVLIIVIAIFKRKLILNKFSNIKKNK